jgi:hypothetical protein
VGATLRLGCGLAPVAWSAISPKVARRHSTTRSKSTNQGNHG